MQDIAPQITRQRLLIEALYTINVDEASILIFFEGITKQLNLRMYGNSIIHSPSGQGKEENQGYDAFVPLVDSGISLYVWTSQKFLSCVIYTCKKFDAPEAVQYMKEFFQTKKLVFQEF